MVTIKPKEYLAGGWQRGGPCLGGGVREVLCDLEHLAVHSCSGARLVAWDEATSSGEVGGG